MRIGLIGAGNMASALARGLGEPIVVSDIDRARAEALGRGGGGEVAGAKVSAAAGAGAAAVETMAGRAAVLREHGNATRDLRRGGTSPGGMTARGPAALERGGIRAAFEDAVAAVVGGVR